MLRLDKFENTARKHTHTSAGTAQSLTFPAGAVVMIESLTRSAAFSVGTTKLFAESGRISARETLCVALPKSVTALWIDAPTNEVLSLYQVAEQP